MARNRFLLTLLFILLVQMAQCDAGIPDEPPEVYEKKLHGIYKERINGAQAINHHLRHQVWKKPHSYQESEDIRKNRQYRHKHSNFGHTKLWKRIQLDANPKHHHHHKSTHNSWLEGLVHSMIMIVSMEFMDKTFFISAIMSMTHNKWLVLLGSVAALFLMNGISCLMGVVLPVIMSRTVTLTFAACLFVFFGVRMIINGIKMDDDNNEEMTEAQEEINLNFKESEANLESSPLISPTTEAKMCKPQDSVALQIFLMIFFAEWGDRSQVSTILLAGTHPVVSVFLGGCLGYFITSLLAVLSGSWLASKVSPRVITITGGILFLLFAFQTIFMK